MIFNSLSDAQSIQGGIWPALINALDKKILLVASFTFGLLALCYIFRNYCFKAKQENCPRDIKYSSPEKDLADIEHSGNKEELFSYLSVEGQKIDKLDLRAFKDVTDEDIALIVKRSPNLEEITLSKNTRNFDKEEFEMIDELII